MQCANSYLLKIITCNFHGLLTYYNVCQTVNRIVSILPQGKQPGFIIPSPHIDHGRYVRITHP